MLKRPIVIAAAQAVEETVQLMQRQARLADVRGRIDSLQATALRLQAEDRPGDALSVAREALELVETLRPLMHRLRFYPRPHDQPQPAGAAMVRVASVGEIAAEGTGEYLVAAVVLGLILGLAAALLLVLLGLVVVFILPNSMEIFNHRDARHPLPAYDGVIRWRASIAWLALTSILCLASILLILDGEPNEFIYFQF